MRQNISEIFNEPHKFPKKPQRPILKCYCAPLVETPGLNGLIYFPMICNTTFEMKN